MVYTALKKSIKEEKKEDDKGGRRGKERYA